jgi:ATP-dependent helicase/nuclease subunit A
MIEDIAPFTANGKAVPESTFQALALNTQQNVVIEACAGSGKTWLLVARMLKLLLQGVSPTHIVAITFTRKAAQEMKARLADMLDALHALHDSPQGEGETLLAAMNFQNDDATQALISAAWQRCRAQGEWPSIMTFHEWFGELRQNAPLSSLSNSGAVLSDDETALKTQAWQQFWGDTRDNPAIHSAMQIGIAHLGLASFEAALNAMLARRAEWMVYCDALKTKQADAEALSHAQLAQQAFLDMCQPVSVPELWEVMRALSPRLNAVAKQYCASQTATPLKRGEGLQAAFAALKGAAVPTQEWPLQQAISSLMKPLSMASGAVVNTKIYKDMQAKLADFPGGATGFEDEIDALHATLQSLHHQASVRRLLPVHEAVLVCGGHLIEVYQANKQARGVMDFTDLEIDACTLLNQLRSEKDALTTTRHVLLDEFQDTNLVQWQSLQAFVLPLLTEAAAGGQAASVFVVGDPKQSIYRFRRADPKLFTHVQRSLQADFGAVLLKTQRTRRNANAVNQWVNAVFAPQAGQVAGLFSTQFTLSKAAGQVGALPLLDDAQIALGHSEAQQVLDTLLAWKQRHPQLAWSQAMVLARKRQALAPIAAALRAVGVASVSADRGGFFALPEIADTVHLLCALNDPADALALLSALRSPLFSLSDAHLSELLIHSSTSNAERWLGIAQLQSPWAQGVTAWLRSWQALCSTIPMHDALDAMMHQAQWAQRFANEEPERTSAIAANLAQLLQVCLSVDQGRYPSFPRFVQAISELRESDALAAQSNASLDAVRLSTIHGAKGLEADCVIMVDTYSRDKADDTVKVLLDWPADAAQPRLFALQLCPAPVLAAVEPLAAVLDAQEQARLLERDTLLYVAMTRAVSELWVSATAKKNSQTIYERLNQARGASPEAEIGAENPVTYDTPASPGESVQASVMGYRYASLPALASLPAPSLAFVKPLVDNTQTSPQALGTLMHHLLEHWLHHQRWHGAVELAQMSNLQGIAPESAVALLERCQSMMRALQLNQLSQQADYLAIEQTLVYQGQQLRPDVVAYQNASKAAWVIDFKLSFSPDHEFASGYAEQLSGYANTVKAAGIEQVGCYIVDLSGHCWCLSHGQWEICQVPWHV